MPLLLIASIAPAQQPCSPTSPTSVIVWPQYGFDPCRSGFNPYEHILSPGTVGNLVLSWKYTMSGFPVQSSPAVANGTVYIGDTSYLYALNANTGALLWRYTTGGYTDSPAIANGLLYVGSDDGTLRALNARTGEVVWTYTTEAEIFQSSPTIVSGVVYIGSRDNSVYALDAGTGALRWKYTTKGWTDSSPAVAGGAVYISSRDGNLYALDANTGSLRWTCAIGGFFVPPPAVADGVVYIGSSAGNLYALNASTGALLWSYAGVIVESSPAVANGVVYFGSDDYNLYALSASTGALLWKYTTGWYGRVRGDGGERRCLPPVRRRYPIRPKCRHRRTSLALPDWILPPGFAIGSQWRSVRRLQRSKTVRLPVTESLRLGSAGCYFAKSGHIRTNPEWESWRGYWCWLWGKIKRLSDRG